MTEEMNAFTFSSFLVKSAREPGMSGARESVSAVLKSFPGLAWNMQDFERKSHKAHLKSLYPRRKLVKIRRS